MMPQLAYDRAITVFSPDGRLFQVEYAREAVKRGTTALGLRSKHGVVLIVDKRVTTKLVEPGSIEKLFQVDEHIGMASSGLVADARVLVDRARLESQINRITYDESVPVEVLAKRICDYKQTYTQFGGVRPFGAALLIAGVDGTGPRLFETDPSGALLEYKATGIGAGRAQVMEIFERKYRDDLTMDEMIMLGLEALYQVAEGRLSPENMDIGVVDVNTKKFRILSFEEKSRIVQEFLNSRK